MRREGGCGEKWGKRPQVRPWLTTISLLVGYLFQYLLDCWNICDIYMSQTDDAEMVHVVVDDGDDVNVVVVTDATRANAPAAEKKRSLFDVLMGAREKKARGAGGESPGIQIETPQDVVRGCAVSFNDEIN